MGREFIIRPAGPQSSIVLTHNKCTGRYPHHCVSGKRPGRSRGRFAITGFRYHSLSLLCRHAVTRRLAVGESMSPIAKRPKREHPHDEEKRHNSPAGKASSATCQFCPRNHQRRGYGTAGVGVLVRHIQEIAYKVRAENQRFGRSAGGRFVLDNAPLLRITAP